jgi:hypothetical protein
MPPLFAPFSSSFKHSSSQDVLSKYAHCEREYLPDKKNRNHQLYCSLSCRSLAKKERDKRHKQAYRKRQNTERRKEGKTDGTERKRGGQNT